MPVVFYRTVWMHAEIGSIDRMLAGHSQTDFPPCIAIWGDGTIIWSEGDDLASREYFEGKLKRGAAESLLAEIETKGYRTRDNLRCSAEAFAVSDLEVSVIAVLGGAKPFLMCSRLDQMELLGAYWRPGSLRTKYALAEYSFEQFCAELPKPASQHLKDYAKLREQLRSMIPEKGKRIDLSQRVRWTVAEFTMPAVDQAGIGLSRKPSSLKDLSTSIAASQR